MIYNQSELVNRALKNVLAGWFRIKRPNSKPFYNGVINHEYVNNCMDSFAGIILFAH